MGLFGETGTGPRIPSAVWAFLSVFGFVMLCGIVGPIFLVTYFLIDEPHTGWMLWTGLGVTVVTVGIAVPFGILAAKRKARSQRLLISGMRAVAQVTSIDRTNVTINDQPLMNVGLHIHGAGVDFVDDSRLVVPEHRQPLLHRRELSVLVDPATREYEIDWDATEKIAARTQQAPVVAGGVPVASDGVPPVSDRPADGPPKTVSERLDDLEYLRIRGAVSPDEYNAARARILGSL